MYNIVTSTVGLIRINVSIYTIIINIKIHK